MDGLYEFTPCEYCAGGLGANCECADGYLVDKVYWHKDEVKEYKEMIQRLVNDMALGRKDVPFNTIGDIALWNGLKAAKEFGFEPDNG